MKLENSSESNTSGVSVFDVLPVFTLYIDFDNQATSKEGTQLEKLVLSQEHDIVKVGDDPRTGILPVMRLKNASLEEPLFSAQLGVTQKGKPKLIESDIHPTTDAFALCVFRVSAQDLEYTGNALGGRTFETFPGDVLTTGNRPGGAQIVALLPKDTIFGLRMQSDHWVCFKFDGESIRTLKH